MKTIKTIFFLFCIGFTFNSFSQSFRYQNAVFTSVDTLKNIEFATADWLNNPIGLLADKNIHDGENKTISKPLYMDIFMPKDDTLKKRPTIIFAHGGAFLTGSRHNDDMVAFCDSFARRGYVTATIDYRLGMGATLTSIFGIPVALKIEGKNAYRAVYRAVQDSRAAIRFLNQNAEIFGIDTTKIYLVGSSAGGILTLQNLYLDKNSEVSPDAFLPPTLGNLDSVGIQGYGAKPAAIVSLWGAVESPELIENEQTPVFLVHGTDDDIVPFKKGIPLSAIVPDNPAISFTMPETYGSFCIDTALNNREITHENYFVEGKKHEFYGVDTGEFYPEGPNEYWDTIQLKISKFLFDRFQPEADFETDIESLTVHFSNTSSDIYDAGWDFGDGTIGSGNEVSHTYAKPGNYNVLLTVFNRNLACDTITKQVW
ncbi:MAG: carboxylesterase family protein [Draconibacterium sp.]|nr:carboxylesterase family protein [Draconibacterium sp.]